VEGQVKNHFLGSKISCKTQAEVDHYWQNLSADPASEQCGWLKDKFGLSWQVIPSMLGKLMSDPDSAKSARVMAAMLSMKKIILADLEKAYHQT
jgi:predicted 3-demethylubiquinone-9 3-methyltransferase (glyoxalase superfamily)